MRMMFCLLVLLSGCTNHSVRCDSRLVPINAPAPKAVAGSAAAEVLP